MELSDLLTLKQAAEFMGLSRQYVWMLIQMGRIKAQQLGGRTIFVTKQDLNKYLSSKVSIN
ncbi:MAG: helix-turn-helix domain-containing protein [Melioribacteraceae bacterium]